MQYNNDELSYPFLHGGVGVLSGAGHNGEGLGGVVKVQGVWLQVLHVFLQHELVLRQPLLPGMTGGRSQQQ